MGNFFYLLTYWDKIKNLEGYFFFFFFSKFRLKNFGMVFQFSRNRRFTTCALRWDSFKVLSHGQSCRCANICIYANILTCANLSRWMDLHTYAKFAPYANSWNLHLAETKCKFQFAYTQILHICKSDHVKGNQNLRTWVFVYLYPINVEMMLFQYCF